MPVEKKLARWDSGWSLTEQRKFLYDGWLMVLELDGSDNVVRKYTWGLDLSGTRGGAGGTLDRTAPRQGQVGGLLAVCAVRARGRWPQA